MAAARNAHDGSAAAATYTEDGEYIGSSRTFKGRIELAQLWGTMKGQMQRTIQAVNFIAPGIAIVHVLSDYPKPAIVGREVFVMVKENGGWKIRVGAAVPWDDGRWNIPLASSGIN
jgi:uncharacterized protein (TIGR02246 family)